VRRPQADNWEQPRAAFLPEKTVGHHVSAILAKLGVSSRLEAVRRARDLSAVS
jgi:DNA-binding NarL/FixJ family response regulator